MLSPIRKSYACNNSCHTEIAPLFSSLYNSVANQAPLQALLRRSDFMGRIAKWGASLGAFNIQYRPRASIKG